jgi:methylated-DNA-protein-cysteine methyltransferase related protein
MTGKRNNKESLKKVQPSGKKESSFFEQVFAIVRQIPKGRVTSYGAIAEALGTRSSARMVGWAMNLSHSVTPELPAHRVVNREGRLTGKVHFGTPTRMQELLQNEGIEVQDDTVVGFKELFWNPASELSL